MPNTDSTYALLNAALVNAGMDPAKAMTQPTYLGEFRELCQEVGVKASAICEAAGL